MIPLHERKNLKFYIDSAVHRRSPSKHAALVRAVRNEYGTLEISMHIADVILIHLGDTACEVYDHVRATLVDYRYIEDDIARQERGAARLPFTNYIFAR